MPWPETDLVWTFCETPQNHLVDFLTPLHKLHSEKGKDYFHRRKICLWHQRHFSAILRFANTQSRRISAVTHIKIFSAEHAQTKCPSAARLYFRRHTKQFPLARKTHVLGHVAKRTSALSFLLSSSVFLSRFFWILSVVDLWIFLLVEHDKDTMSKQLDCLSRNTRNSCCCQETCLN